MPRNDLRVVLSGNIAVANRTRQSANARQPPVTRLARWDGAAQGFWQTPRALAWRRCKSQRGPFMLATADLGARARYNALGTRL
jgi:hypothetical protein